MPRGDAAFDGPLLDADDLGGAWLDPLREEATAGVTVVAGTALRWGTSRRLAQLVTARGSMPW
jgi:hypothetical protein